MTALSANKSHIKDTWMHIDGDVERKTVIYARRKIEDVCLRILIQTSFTQNMFIDSLSTGYLSTG